MAKEEGKSRFAKEVPPFKDKDGLLIDYIRTDFPLKVAGEVAWRKYRILVAQDRLDDIEGRSSPKAKMLRRKTKLEKELKEINEELKKHK